MTRSAAERKAKLQRALRALRPPGIFRAGLGKRHKLHREIKTMFCPECGLEYRDGFTRCSDCDVDLTAQPPKHGEPDVKLVKVFETVNPVLITVVESLFDGAEIDFLTRSGDLQELISGARLATGINSAMGPVEFWVREDEESNARELLADLDRGSEAELLEDESVPGARDSSDG